MDDSPLIDSTAAAAGDGRAREVALRRWLPVAVLVAAALVVAGRWWDPATPGARILAALVTVVALGSGGRLLVPAGRSGRRPRPAPGLPRRAAIAGMVILGAMVGLLFAYAVTSAWVLPVVALAAVPVLWSCRMLETRGGALRDWWRATRRELREVWTEPARKSGHR